MALLLPALGCRATPARPVALGLAAAPEAAGKNHLKVRVTREPPKRSEVGIAVVPRQ